MKIYGMQNVFEATMERLIWLHKEFGRPIVNVSGGKDSTVLLRMTILAARECDMLPVRAVFIDQEAEWQSTIDQITHEMYDPEVEPHWVQAPFLLSNATSAYEQWLHCWDPANEERWMRPKDPISIHENNYRTDRFKSMFTGVMRKTLPEGGAGLTGMRCDEAPGRMMTLTSGSNYKGACWGNGWSVNDAQFWTFSPLYDWSYTDIWKAIHDNGWTYSKLYDQLYQRGTPVKNMRVSSLIHEEAIGSLFFMQEVEPKTYERLVQRIEGIDMAGKMGFRDYNPSSLPYMFRDWKEYRDFLLPKLVTREDWQAKLNKKFAIHDERYGEEYGDTLMQLHVAMILTNDHEGAKCANFEVTARKKAKDKVKKA